MTIGEATAQAHAFRPGEGILRLLGERLQCGRLAIALPDGRKLHFAGRESGPLAKLAIHDWRCLRRILFKGAEGFAESYMAGECDTPDLRHLLTLAARNLEVWEKVLKGSLLSRATGRLLHLLHPNTRRGAKRNIARHYDLSNEFYSAWLDRGMTYSSAVFAGEAVTLEAAQQEKYRRIAHLADVRREHHLLEIGCGWGGFAEFAARELGARVTAVTLSEQQFAFARRRIAEAGLGERVEIRRQDYRQVEGSFDRIVSIEMFEAVGERYWPLFFQRLQQNLRQGGRAALQVITIAEERFPRYRRRADFIQRHIFPGGMLPSLQALKTRSREAGLTWLGSESRARDYVLTLAAWHARFDAAWPRIAGLGFDERFRRLWKYYLAYCEAGFDCGRTDLLQIALERCRR